MVVKRREWELDIEVAAGFNNRIELKWFTLRVVFFLALPPLVLQRNPGYAQMGFAFFKK